MRNKPNRFEMVMTNAAYRWLAVEAKKRKVSKAVIVHELIEKEIGHKG